MCRWIRHTIEKNRQQIEHICTEYTDKIAQITVTDAYAHTHLILEIIMVFARDCYHTCVL